MSAIIKYVNIELDVPMRRNQIRYLRGLVVERAGRQHDLLHNHRDGRADQYHYRYPLVQYKVVKGRATLLGLNAGADTLRALTDTGTMRFADSLNVLRFREEYTPIRMTEAPQRYMLRQWLALNGPNYERWRRMSGSGARLAELERILAAHLLAFAAGVGFDVPRPRGLELRIEKAEAPRTVRCHDGRLLSFDVVFQANMLLPADVGIGKSASHGYGIAYPLPERVRPGGAAFSAPQRLFLPVEEPVGELEPVG